MIALTPLPNFSIPASFDLKLQYCWLSIQEDEVIYLYTDQFLWLVLRVTLFGLMDFSLTSSLNRWSGCGYVKPLMSVPFQVSEVFW